MTKVQEVGGLVGRFLPDENDQQGPTLQAQMQKRWDALFTQLFPEAPAGARRRRMLERYALAVLSGLATTTALAGRSARTPRPELELLKDTLTRELLVPTAARPA